MTEMTEGSMAFLEAMRIANEEQMKVVDQTAWPVVSKSSVDRRWAHYRWVAHRGTD